MGGAGRTGEALLKLVFFGNGQRGVSCLRAVLADGFKIDLAVSHPTDAKAWPGSFAEAARAAGLPLLQPEDPNDPAFVARLREFAPDVTVLGGYGKILKAPIIAVAARMTVNLHGGRLPKYRGSSPMNWALINGEREFGISIIKVDAGVDTGDLLLERVFPIDPAHTIADLHHRANAEFPDMLLEVLRGFAAGSLVPRKQAGTGSYYPLRFSEDGFILWDMLTAEQVHNRIRALTEPYPCAFTYYRGRKVRLLASALPEEDFFGEPGRIYRISPTRGALVCASDKCLWLSRAVFEDGSALQAAAERYAQLATVRDFVLSSLQPGSIR